MKYVDVSLISVDQFGILDIRDKAVLDAVAAGTFALAASVPNEGCTNHSGCQTGNVCPGNVGKCLG